MLTMPKVGSLREAMSKVDAGGDDNKVVSMGGPSLDNLSDSIKSLEKRRTALIDRHMSELAVIDQELLSTRKRLVKELESRKLGIDTLTEETG